MSLISCAVMPYACTTVHGRGSSLQRRTMPDFGFKAASSHVNVCVVSVLSSTWMTCSIMLSPAMKMLRHETSSYVMVAGSHSSYGDRGHTGLCLGGGAVCGGVWWAGFKVFCGSLFD